MPMTRRHEVLQLWVRPASGRAPEAQDALELRAGEGIVGDHTHGSSSL